MLLFYGTKVVIWKKWRIFFSDDLKCLPIVFEGEYDDLKFIIEKEKEIKDFLTTLVGKEVVKPDVFKRLCPKGSKPGIIYGLCKVHKENTTGDCPPFRPILSAIDTTSYNLATFLVLILSPYTPNNSYVANGALTRVKISCKKTSKISCNFF